MKPANEVEERHTSPNEIARKMYSNNVKSGVCEILGMSNKKRGASVGSQGEPKIELDSQIVKKEPTYIQKLMSLGRKSSGERSENQYAYNVPSWQTLLKGKQQALISSEHKK